MKSAVQKIPQNLIYEMVNGEPIYYKGYKDYLAGKKQIGEIIGSSILQSLIISRLVFLLQSNIDDNYEILTNELGIQFSKKSWRAADICILKTEDLNKVKDKDKYLTFPPDLVIEIDTKAELNEISDPLGYYHKKRTSF